MRTTLIALVVAIVATGCSSGPGGASSGKFQVVASVAPITDIVKNVAGNAADVQGLIPEGVDSHTFEPTSDTARLIADADLIFLNGLDLEDPTLALAESDKKDSAQFQAAYRTALESCYSCHKSVGRPYLRPQIPKTVPQTIVNMDPNATWPQ